MQTEEQRKESRRITSAKWRAKNKDYQVKWKAKNKDYDAKWRNEVFYVYTHTNSKGDLYIGHGNKRRPYTFNVDKARGKKWIEAFDNDCQVNIIAEFKDKDSARELERSMIAEIGLDNLINTLK